MRLTKVRLTGIGVLIVLLVGFTIFSRARTVSSVCSGQKEITQTINKHDKALKEFIAANVEARQHTADLAFEEHEFAEGRLQHSIAVQYAEIGTRFTDLPVPPC